MAAPIAQNDPSSLLPGLINAYQPLASLPTDVLAPVMQLDLDRVRKGQSPLSGSDRLLALQAAMNQTSAIQQPKKSFWGNIVGDVEGIAQSIPHLPQAVINEAMQLPEAPSQIAQGLQDQSIKEIARAPGVRMLPGSYLAENGPKAFLEHPVLASLDLAPAIDKGVGLLPEAVTAPVKDATLGTLDKFGLGPLSQETARTVAQANRALTRGLVEHAETVAKIQQGLTDADVVRLTEVAQRGNQAEIGALPKFEQDKIGQIRDLTDSLGQRATEAGFLGQFDGEYYPTQQANVMQRLRTRYWNAAEAGDQAGMDKSLQQFQRYSDRTPPARFRPLLDQEFRSRLSNLAQSNNPDLVGEAWNRVQEVINNRFYDQVPNVTEKDLAGLAHDITPLWQTLKEQGADPIFIHSVGPEQMNKLRSPKIFPAQETSPTFARVRTWNMKPGITNFAVGLNHQGLEILQHEATNAVIDSLRETWGKTRSQMLDEFIPKAQATDLGPGVPLAARVEQMMARGYTKWDPEGMFPWQKARATAGLTPEEEWYLPKPVETAIRKMYPVDRSELARLYDTGMGVFRVGILPLSPRWHVYNIVGGLPMLLARTGPGVLQYFGDALKMVKEGRMPDGLSQGLATVPDDLRTAQWETGRNIGDFVKNKWGQNAQNALDKFGHPLSNVIQKSFDFNELVDNMYRSMAYLYGQDKGLTKGMTAAEAEEAGVRLSNKVLQDWDGMTPIERQVIRSVFPFYGWMKHITSYVFSYPWDHPYRASIVSNFARNEMADWKNGLPTQFRNYLFWGKPDAQGNQHGLNVRGMNPFADVSNYFTLAGFVSQLNPLAEGLMTAMGFNPRTGSASLYPSVTYDDATGKLVPATKNPVLTIAQGFVPQAAAISSLLGFDNSDLKQLKLNNPDAYRSRILSSLGLPAQPKEVNQRLEIARSELARKTVLQDALSSAIKTGDWSSAAKYPQLRPIIDLLSQLDQQGALDQFHVQSKNAKGFQPADLVTMVRGNQGG